MTRLENRLLYLIRKSQPAMAQQQKLSQATSRFKARDRNQALANLENLGLVSSAKKPASRRGGRASIVYWLTSTGDAFVDDMIERGEIADPTSA